MNQLLVLKVITLLTFVAASSGAKATSHREPQLGADNYPSPQNYHEDKVFPLKSPKIQKSYKTLNREKKILPEVHVYAYAHPEDIDNEVPSSNPLGDKSGPTFLDELYGTQIQPWNENGNDLEPPFHPPVYYIPIPTIILLAPCPPSFRSIYQNHNWMPSYFSSIEHNVINH